MTDVPDQIILFSSAEYYSGPDKDYRFPLAAQSSKESEHGSEE